MVWPLAVGLWNMRCQVRGTMIEYPDIKEKQLASKFAVGSGVGGVNYRRFIDKPWEQQKEDFAWILLINTIAIYEDWIKDLHDNIFEKMREDNLQSAINIKNEIQKLMADQSDVLTNSFYSTYASKKKRCYSNIEALLYCYRLFKQSRNCYMHNGAKADKKLILAYNEYLPFADKAALNVEEVPVYIEPKKGERINISLRGVVGFSDIVIKIIASLDTELLCAKAAEKEFCKRFIQKQPKKRTLSSDKAVARQQAKRYVMQCGFIEPQNIDDMIQFLYQNRLVSR